MAQGKPFERSHQGNPSQNDDLVAHFLEVSHNRTGQLY